MPFTLLISLLVSLFSSIALAQSKQPNIIFILADDLGYGDLGSYGHPYAKTPALDRLAREGTRFTKFYATGVTCSPSRTGFMTSKHPASYKYYMKYHGFSGRITITELLKSRGYRTGHFGKWHIGPEKANGVNGIDVIKRINNNHESTESRDAGVFDAAIEFIKNNKDKPFYANIWSHISHYPVDPKHEIAEPYKGLVVDKSDFGQWMQEKINKSQTYGKNLDVSMQNYLGDVTSLDGQVAKLLKAIDALNLRENTIVVFSSDQGPAPIKTSETRDPINSATKPGSNMLGYSGGLRGGKHEQYEGGVRIPFIIRWPKEIPAGRIDNTSVLSALDWLPTLANITGIEIDSNQFEGINVADVWKGATRSTERTLFWKTSSVKSKPSILVGKWKLHYVGKSKVELFDLANDPNETKDVSAENRNVVKQLISKIENWKKTLPTEYIN